MVIIPFSYFDLYFFRCFVQMGVDRSKEALRATLDRLNLSNKLSIPGLTKDYAAKDQRMWGLRVQCCYRSRFVVRSSC